MNCRYTGTLRETPESTSSLLYPGRKRPTGLLISDNCVSYKRQGDRVNRVSRIQVRDGVKGRSPGLVGSRFVTSGSEGATVSWCISKVESSEPVI